MDRLASIARDYHQEPPTYRPTLPWSSGAIPAFGEAVRKYISRFATMASQAEPPAGDLVEWFSSRTEYAAYQSPTHHPRGPMVGGETPWMQLQVAAHCPQEALGEFF